MWLQVAAVGKAIHVSWLESCAGFVARFTQTFETHLSANINQIYLENITVFMEQKKLCSKEENRKNLGTRRKVLKLKF